MVQNIYFNTFFVKIDPGAPLKPPKSSFFKCWSKTQKVDISALSNHILSIGTCKRVMVECPGTKKNVAKP